MTIDSITTLTHLLEENHRIIHMQLKGITQEESLLQLPFRGNCMNWVIGHILGVRGRSLELLGQPNTLNEAEQKIYDYGSEPLTDARIADNLAGMLKRLDESCETLTRLFGGLTAQDLEREVEIWRGKVSLLEALSFRVWHEAYHVGQLELLRQLAGKNDKVI